MLSIVMGNFSSPGKLNSKKARSNYTVEEEDHDIQRLSIQRQILIPHLECGYRVDSSDTVDEAERLLVIHHAVSRLDESCKFLIREYNVSCYDPLLLHREITALQQLSHPSLPKMIEMFQTHEKTSLVLAEPSYDMNLAMFTSPELISDRLTPYEIRKVFKALFSTICYCHDQLYILRVLTAKNILIRRVVSIESPSRTLRNEIEVHINDLSLAIDVINANNDPLSNHPLYDWAMEPFLAPELAWGLSYSSIADFWSLGVLLYLMICGTVPFTAEEYVDEDSFEASANSASYFQNEDSQHIWVEVKSELKDMIKGCLTADPFDRFGAKEIRRNKWFSS
jgi:serine/threonine protein kinase